MKVTVVVAHPNTGKSFNHALAQTVCDTLRGQGHDVVLHDLYAERFEPVMPVGEEKADENNLPMPVREAMNDIRESAAIVFVHPNWWSAPPAILKGWIDRVLRAGFAYHFTEKGPIGFLTDKKILVLSTSNTPQEIEVNVHKDPIDHFWRNIVFGLCGCRSFEHHNFGPIVVSTPEERSLWLNAVADMIPTFLPAD